MSAANAFAPKFRSVGVVFIGNYVKFIPLVDYFIIEGRVRGNDLHFITITYFH